MVLRTALSHRPFALHLPGVLHFVVWHLDQRLYDEKHDATRDDHRRHHSPHHLWSHSHHTGLPGLFLLESGVATGDQRLRTGGWQVVLREVASLLQGRLHPYSSDVPLLDEHPHHDDYQHHEQPHPNVCLRQALYTDATGGGQLLPGIQVGHDGLSDRGWNHRTGGTTCIGKPARR